MDNINRRKFVSCATATAIVIALVSGSVTAQAAAPPELGPTLITNARIFNGTSPNC